MAVIETWLRQDLKGLVSVRSLQGQVFSLDNGGNLIGVKVTKDGQPVTLTGTVTGYCILSDGQTVNVTGDGSSGIQNGNEAYIVLPQLVYSVPGQISIVIKLTSGETTTTLAACTGYVYKSRTSNEVVPSGTPIPDLATMEEVIRQATAATESATTAATGAENVNASMTKEGDVITITVTDRDGNVMTETMTDTASDVSKLKSSFEQLNDNVIVDSAGPAPIVSIADGADDQPMKAVKVAIEPVQDLHGYDVPWPGGGGKNKCSYTPYTGGVYNAAVGTVVNLIEGGPINVNGSTISFEVETWGNYNFRTPVLHAGTYHVHFAIASSVDGSFRGSFYTIGNNGTNDIIKTSSTYGAQNGTKDHNITVDEGDYICLNLGSNSAATITITDFQIESGSTATAWSPYSNICPITGWTGAKVTRTGKNLFDETLYRNLMTTYEYLSRSYRCRKIQLAPNTTYTISQRSGTAENVLILLNNNAQVNSGGFFDCRLASDTKTYTTDSTGCLYIGTYTDGNSTYNARLALCKLQIEDGSQATAYEEYQGQTYEVTFPTEAGTVYGGTLDVVSGKLVVDRAMVQIRAAMNKSMDGNDNYFWYSAVGTLSIPVIKELNAKLISNRMIKTTNVTNFSPDGLITFYANGIIRWKEQGTLTLSEYNSYLSENPLEICYEIATPITYTLTPQEIKTLLGANNLWADAGNTSITYPADTKLYIDKKIAELQALILENNS